MVRRGRGPGAGVVLRETVQAEGSSGEAKGEEGGTETAGEVRLTVGESPWGTMGQAPLGRGGRARVGVAWGLHTLGVA